MILTLVAALPIGRFWAAWLLTRRRWLAQSAVGLSIEHSEIEADLQRRRLLDVDKARKSLVATFAEYRPAMQRLLRFAELDPDHALVRWGNFDRTVLLPANIFQADDTGRSYRFRPNVRSIWVRNFPVKGQVKAYFQVLDTPEIHDLVKGTGAVRRRGLASDHQLVGLCAGPSPISRRAGEESLWAIPTCRACSSPTTKRRPSA